MNTTKELADWLRCMIGQNKPIIGLTMETAAKIGVALDHYAAIEAAVPEEVREIAAQLQEAKEQWDAGNPKVVDGVFEHCGTLLAIVQRGAVALRNTIRDASRAEVEQLRAELGASEMDRRELRAMLAVANDKLDKRTQELLAAEAANEAALDHPRCYSCKEDFKTRGEVARHQVRECEVHPIALIARIIDAVPDASVVCLEVRRILSEYERQE